MRPAEERRGPGVSSCVHALDNDTVHSMTSTLVNVKTRFAVEHPTCLDTAWRGFATISLRTAIGLVGRGKTWHLHLQRLQVRKGLKDGRRQSRQVVS